MKSFLLFVVLLISTIQSFCSNLEENTNAKITAIRSKERIVIDGKLTEKIWDRSGFDRLIQQDPEQGVKPTQHSEFWVAYDNEAIYFAAKFYDSKPDSIMARLVRRDFIWG